MIVGAEDSLPAGRNEVVREVSDPHRGEFSPKPFPEDSRNETIPHSSRRACHAIPDYPRVNGASPTKRSKLVSRLWNGEYPDDTRGRGNTRAWTPAIPPPVVTPQQGLPEIIPHACIEAPVVLPSGSRILKNYPDRIILGAGTVPRRSLIGGGTICQDSG